MLPGWVAYPATLLIVVGTALYIRDIRRGTVVGPNLVTWGLWSLAPLIAFAAQLRAGVGAEAWLSAAVGICPFAVFVIGVWQGEFRPAPFDYCCAAMSLVALVSWRLSGNGGVGVMLSIVADTWAAAPLVRDVYVDPRAGSPRLFAFFAISALITLLTITQWTVVNAAFSVYIFGLYVGLFMLVHVRKGKVSAVKEQE